MVLWVTVGRLCKDIVKNRNFTHKVKKTRKDSKQMSLFKVNFLSLESHFYLASLRISLDRNVRINCKFTDGVSGSVCKCLRKLQRYDWLNAGQFLVNS